MVMCKRILGRTAKYSRGVLIDALREIRQQEKKKYPNMFFINVRHQWIKIALNDLNGLAGAW